MTAASPLRSELQRTGVVVVRGAIDVSLIREVARALKAMADAPDVRGGVWKYLDDEARDRGERVLSRIERLAENDPVLAEVVKGPLLRLASEALGEGAVLFKDKANLKLPGSGGFAPHQDAQAGWSTYAPLHMTAMLSVDRTSAENGCIEFVEGPRRTKLAGPEWKPLEAGAFQFQALPTEPGDVVLFDSFVVHRSAPNRTTEPRRVVYATYNAQRHGDSYARYFSDKLRAYPPEAERAPGSVYRYRV